MKRALISGAAGFIGRHFHRRLAHDGWSVDAFDIRPAATPELYVRQVDALDWFRAVGGGYDLVIHCAAVIGGRAKIEGDPLAVGTNLSLDAEMFRWAARTRPARIVYFSSSAVYPTMLQAGLADVRLRESDTDPRGRAFGAPDETYGWAKLTGEMLAEKARAAGLRVHVFRPFSGYGTDQDQDYPFPAFVDRALKRQDPFTVWGDGLQVRDWIHVDDIVEAVLTAIAVDIRGPVNLGSGIPVTFRELAAMVCSAAGYEPRLSFDADKPAGVRYRVANVEKLREFYEPQVHLQDGIQRALAMVRV